MNFIALSINTANQWPDSICSIQLCKIENNQVVDSLSTYINTNQSFDPFYVSQHGIEEADVQNAPSFIEFYPILQNWLEQQAVISFYQPYEALCIKESFESIGQLAPHFQHYSLLPHLKRTLPKQQSYTLYETAATLSLPEQLTHADYVAEISLTLMKEERNWTTLLKEQLPYNSEPLISLAQKTIIFTGALSGMRRSDAAKLVMRAGGFFTNTMSKKVDILVISQKSLDRHNINEHQSSKWRNALSLQQQGYPIEIIMEEQFIQLIQK